MPAIAAALTITTGASSVPIRAQKGMVASQNEIASRIGADVIAAGGTAVDAAVATAFALAVTHPDRRQHRRRRLHRLPPGQRRGGHLRLPREGAGQGVADDVDEGRRSTATSCITTATSRSACPGTVAGLHLAWKEQGKLPWKRLVDPAIALARDGFTVTEALARSLKNVQRTMQKYPASVAAFTKNGVPYDAGETLKQPDLARTLDRIAAQGPAGFYEGETALLLEKEMLAHGGLITREDLKNYAAVRRAPVKGSYRGYEVISMPPPSSGGVGLLEMLNVLEGYDLKTMGFASASADSRDGRVDEARLRRPREVPRRSRLQHGHADRSADVEAVLRRSAQDDQPGQGVEVVAGDASSGRTKATRRRRSRWWTRTATRCR